MPADTPMFRQYDGIKEQHRDAVLFFRMGDFYEMFKSDAVEVSRLLNLTLTQRQGVPMCGIPYHASGNYIGRLLKTGKKIAICEQIELPQGGKGLARREVVEVLSPGTVVDDSYLEEKNNNYLAAAGMTGGGLSFAYVDLSTGEFCTAFFPREDLNETLRRELARTSPREIIIQESLMTQGAFSFLSEGQAMLNRLPDWSFDLPSARDRLLRHFGTVNLKAFGLEEDSPEILSAGVLMEYLEENAKSFLPHIRGLRVYREGDAVGMDEATIRNLEIIRNLQDGGEGFTLLDSLDYTRTSFGARQLKRWLLSPPAQIKVSAARHEQVESLYRDQAVLGNLREILGGILDLERLGARLAMDRAHAKDLLAIRDSLDKAEQIQTLLKDSVLVKEGQFEELFQTLKKTALLLSETLQDDPSILLTEGRLIREGWNAVLDELREKQSNGRKYLNAYLDQERKETGLNSLKLKYNRILGWFFEISRNQAENLPEHFHRRQSLTGVERCSTDRLSALEVELSSVSEVIVEKEKEFFLQLREKAKKDLPAILEGARLLAKWDVLQSFAYAATIQGFIRPRLNQGQKIKITRGRHPVVERHLPPGTFVPNSLDMDAQGNSFLLVTGPNMAGKSTVLRQAALIVLMAQAGSFVPAENAEIGVADRIFCRVGASDNLARGESTFLVEMNETAHILRNATESSLVIMDEVGRGTGTSDGLAIAQAVCEYLLNKVKSRTLFATHYRELTLLDHSRLANFSMAVKEEGNKVIFPKTLIPGPAEASYGIHAAALAGLPEQVISRAWELLAQYGDQDSPPPPPPVPPPSLPAQPSLFDPREMVLEELASLGLDKLSPLEALNLLARWQKEIFPSP